MSFESACARVLCKQRHSGGVPGNECSDLHKLDDEPATPSKGMQHNLTVQPEFDSNKMS